MHSRVLARKVPKSQREAVKEGRWGSGVPVFGYFTQKGKGLVPNPQTAPIVLQCFKKYAAGESIRSIAKWLNTNVSAQRGGSWRSGTVHNLLTRRAYLGHITYGALHRVNGKRVRVPLEERTENPNQHKPLVPQKLFDQVQERLSRNDQSRAKGPRPTNVLAVVGRCKCGSTLTFQKGGGPRKDRKKYTARWFWHCSRCRLNVDPRRNFEGCYGYFPQDVVETMIRDRMHFLLAAGGIKQAVQAYNAAAAQASEPPELATLKTMVDGLRKRERSLVEFIGDGSRSFDAVAEDLEKTQTDRQDAEKNLAQVLARVSQIQSPIDEAEIEGASDKIRKALKAGDIAKRAVVLPHLVSKIEIDFTLRHDTAKYWRRRAQDFLETLARETRKEV